MRRLFSVLSVLAMCALPFTASAELNLDAPEQLIERASQGKNQLRDVINELDQNLTEMRDVRTFEQYFFLLDQLQELAVKHNLDTIYPEAVTKLGHRMVQKGVNWLDVVLSPTETILYYHKWMEEPQPAFSFLYAADLRIKEEQKYENLKTAAINLEASMALADTKWVNDRALRLLYRSTLSDLAAKVLKKSDLADEETEFWISKLYAAESMGELVTFLQASVYDIKAETKSSLHFALRRLIAIHSLVVKPSFGAPDNLLGQIGDTAVDIILKSFRFDEKLTDAEFEGALGVMNLRHFASLASSWTGFGKIPKSPEFAGYYIERAFAFVAKLQNVGLQSEANALSRAITAKAAAIIGCQHKIEGSWSMRDSAGKKWTLHIIHASEDLVFASFVDEKRFVLRGYYNVIYDIHNKGFIATERASDVDISPNLPLRFTPQADGTMEVQDLMLPGQAAMTAKREQSFPQYVSDIGEGEDGPDLNGVYEGTITIPGGKRTKATLTLTVMNGYTVGNMRYLDGQSNSTFNYGTEGMDGTVHLTRGANFDRGNGVWMHMRAKLEGNVLKSHAIFGNAGLIPQQFQLKKVK